MRTVRRTENNGGCGIALQFLVEFFFLNCGDGWRGQLAGEKQEKTMHLPDRGLGGREQKNDRAWDDWFSDVDLLVGVFFKPRGHSLLGRGLGVAWWRCGPKLGGVFGIDRYLI